MKSILPASIVVACFVFLSVACKNRGVSQTALAEATANDSQSTVLRSQATCKMTVEGQTIEVALYAPGGIDMQSLPDGGQKTGLGIVTERQPGTTRSRAFQNATVKATRNDASFRYEYSVTVPQGSIFYVAELGAFADTDFVGWYDANIAGERVTADMTCRI